MTTDRRPDRRLLAAFGVLAVLVVACLVWRWSPPPQIGTDEAVVKTVDALFTAMTTKDPKRLDDCDQRLKSYQADGRLPARAASRLQGFIQQAREGKWDPAARGLYAVIYGQRGL
jgi:hypothetical protein